jgi:hypothetical protein
MKQMYLYLWLMSLCGHDTFGYGGIDESISVSIWFETVIRLRGILSKCINK